jgi:hypothetical protein
VAKVKRCLDDRMDVNCTDEVGMLTMWEWLYFAICEVKRMATAHACPCLGRGLVLGLHVCTKMGRGARRVATLERGHISTVGSNMHVSMWNELQGSRQGASWTTHGVTAHLRQDGAVAVAAVDCVTGGSQGDVTKTEHRRGSHKQ